MKTIKELTQQDVIDLVLYDPVTGKCYWRVRGVQWFRETKGRSAQHACNNWNSLYAGKEIKTLGSQGYITLSLLKDDALLHRVILFRQTGIWPEYVDHINGIRTDNRWENLRSVTAQENCKNNRKRSDNTSGVTGVFKFKRDNNWMVYIGDKFLGYYDTFDEAVAVRKAAEIEHGYSETHGRD